MTTTDISASVVYHAVCGFRWYWPEEYDYNLDRRPPRLQQAWQGSDGSVKWEDVPTVTTEAEP